MRYSLGTLVILSAALPPLAAIVWFFAPTRFMNDLAGACGWPGILLTLALATFSTVYWPRKEAQPVTLGAVSGVALWCVETAVLTFWVSSTMFLGGWFFIWGDNGPPVSMQTFRAIAVCAAAAIASVTSVRMWLGYATVNYIMFVLIMTTLLLLLLTPYHLWHIASYGNLPPLPF